MRRLIVARWSDFAVGLASSLIQRSICAMETEGKCHSSLSLVSEVPQAMLRTVSMRR